VPPPLPLLRPACEPKERIELSISRLQDGCAHQLHHSGVRVQGLEPRLNGPKPLALTLTRHPLVGVSQRPTRVPKAGQRRLLTSLPVCPPARPAPWDRTTRYGLIRAASSPAESSRVTAPLVRQRPGCSPEECPAMLARGDQPARRSAHYRSTAGRPSNRVVDRIRTRSAWVEATHA